MFQNKFYWGTVRKAVIAFGSMFNDIHIDRKDSSGNNIQTLNVPLSYAPKQKFLARIAAQPQSFEQSFETYLPRMSFEMLGMQYDPARRVSVFQKNRAINTTVNTLNAQYAPTPYNLSMSLYVFSKNSDDALQIVEQILPYFNPDFNLTLNAIPDLGIKNDLQIILDNIVYDDEYESDFSQRRAIYWTLNFTMKMNFYGPISTQSIIRNSTVNTFSDPAMANAISSYSATVSAADVPGANITVTDNFLTGF
jgi:hypothetical protein